MIRSSLLIIPWDETTGNRTKIGSKYWCMINTILYLSQKQGRYSPRKKTYPVPTHYLAFKISENHRMTPKNKSILLTRLYHIKNNFLAAEINSRHAKIMYLGILVTKKILCWQRILIILVRIKYCLVLPLYRSISIKPD